MKVAPQPDFNGRRWAVRSGTEMLGTMYTHYTGAHSLCPTDPTYGSTQGIAGNIAAIFWSSRAGSLDGGQRNNGGGLTGIGLPIAI